jgi:hypothetical protein
VVMITIPHDAAALSFTGAACFGARAHEPAWRI